MAKKHSKEKKKSQKEINRENLEAGIFIVKKHPLFGRCMPELRTGSRDTLGSHTMCIVYANGVVVTNESITLLPQQWAYVIAHNILHLAFGHFDAEHMPGYTADSEYTRRFPDRCFNAGHMPDYTASGGAKIPCNFHLWNMACDIYVDQFLSDIKFGQPLYRDSLELYAGDEQKIYQSLLQAGATGQQNPYGTAAIGAMDMKGLEKPLEYDKEKGQYNRFSQRFTYALAHSVSKTVSEAGGHAYQSENDSSDAGRAARWFIDHYPLLGGLAAHFKLVEDYGYCSRNDIHIAAIDADCGEIYINTASNLSLEEWKFVLAHEYLHAGLQHHRRCNGRDHYLWNIACDFVINGWLREIQIGTMPGIFRRTGRFC